MQHVRARVLWAGFGLQWLSSVRAALHLSSQRSRQHRTSHAALAQVLGQHPFKKSKLPRRQTFQLLLLRARCRLIDSPFVASPLNPSRQLTGHPPPPPHSGYCLRVKKGWVGRSEAKRKFVYLKLASNFRPL